MNVPSRSALILSSVLAGLLLTGVVFWRHEIRSRQYAEENGHFEKKYISALNDLRLAQDAVSGYFRKNETVIIKIKKPDSGVATATTTQGATATPEPIILQGVSWGAEKPVAMLDGKVYQTGDRIGEFTLEEIRIRSILLRGPDGTVTEIKLMEETHENKPL